MKALVFNFKSGNTLTVPIKADLNATNFRQLLAALNRDTCITDTNIVDDFYCIDTAMVESVVYTEVKTKKTKLTEDKNG